MKTTFCEWPDAPDSGGPECWEKLRAHTAKHGTDLLVLNEMPFGKWLSTSDTYDRGSAAESIRAHDAGIIRLHTLGVPAIIASRPIKSPSKLANEAFLLCGEDYTVAHHKHYFPQEAGYFERTWFEPTRPGFEPVALGPLRVGVLLCTELMFTEWARLYGRLGAHLIAVPRASGLSTHQWHIAARDGRRIVRLLCDQLQPRQRPVRRRRLRVLSKGHAHRAHPCGRAVRDR
jgi:N-carbamoylputrescine amidase